MIEARIAAFVVALLLVFVAYHMRRKQTFKQTLANREQAVETRFGIRISDDEAARTATVGDFVELVAAKVGESR